MMIISNDDNDDDDDHQGELHLTESVCPRDFLGELEYWGLSALHLGEASAMCLVWRIYMNILYHVMLLSCRVKYFYSRAVLRLHAAEGLLAAATRGPGSRQRRGGQQGLYKHYKHDVIYLFI